VRQLAPSLLALADLCDMAHRQSGDALGLAPALQVTANSEGSFLVDLYLVLQDAGGTLRDALTSDEASAVVNAAELGGLLLGAISWTVRRRRYGRETVTVESMDFNRTAGYVFEPLRDEGIDEVELSRESGDGEDAVVVRRDDLPAFNIIEPDDDLISDNVRLVNVRLRTVPFKEGNKWKVNDGASTFWVEMRDLEFLQRVAASEEVFAQGDRMYVRLREQQFQGVDGDFRMEHIIEKVMEHRRAVPADPLPFEQDPAERR
jgi:hypothetical protein